MRESPIKGKIVKYLNSLPQSQFFPSLPGAPTGQPDITGCIQGRYLAIEVKVPGGKAKRHQTYVLDQLSKAGAACTIATSVKEVRSWLQALGLLQSR